MKDFRDRVGILLRHCTSNFGEEVVYFPRDGGAQKLSAIFDNNYESVDPETEQVISSNQPMIGVNLNDVKFEIRINDQVQVRNLKYKVIEVREDGQGGASLFLHKIEHEKKVFKKKNSTSP